MNPFSVDPIMQITESKYYSPEEYLALEAVADYKSEYIDGRIDPMTGGTTNHNQVIVNISSELNFAFKKLNYRVFVGDVRLWIPRKRIFTYPDVMVIEGEPEYFKNRTDTITNPKAIVEVLSDSTAAYDRGDKFRAYRTIPTFEEYLLIDQNKIYIEQFSRDDNQRWSLRAYEIEDEVISLTSMNIQITLADVYHKVELPPSDDEAATEIETL